MPVPTNNGERVDPPVVPPPNLHNSILRVSQPYMSLADTPDLENFSAQPV